MGHLSVAFGAKSLGDAHSTEANPGGFSRILDALAEHRLITLAGLGGFGKTRLTVESASAAEGFDPIAFVPLAECNDAALIADCIRGALRIEATRENALAQLCAFLSERDVLLVLDNFEQLVGDGTRVVLDLLERLPSLRRLVTSRRVLDVPGEHVLTIDPLPVPRPSMDTSGAVATPSLALFIDRDSVKAVMAATSWRRAARGTLRSRCHHRPQEACVVA